MIDPVKRYCELARWSGITSKEMKALTQLAAEIRREENEACAKVCKDAIASPISEPFMEHCADLIRARMEGK